MVCGCHWTKSTKALSPQGPGCSIWPDSGGGKAGRVGTGPELQLLSLLPLSSSKTQAVSARPAGLPVTVGAGQVLGWMAFQVEKHLSGVPMACCRETTESLGCGVWGCERPRLRSKHRLLSLEQVCPCPAGLPEPSMGLTSCHLGASPWAVWADYPACPDTRPLLPTSHLKCPSHPTCFLPRGCA